MLALNAKDEFCKLVFFAFKSYKGYNMGITKSYFLCMAKQSKPKKRIKIPAKTEKYLENSGLKYNILEHRTVYTAIDAAATMKKKIEEIAKSLLIQADRNYYLLILPADNNLDFNKLKKIIEKQVDGKIKSIKIPNEKMLERTLKIKAGTLTAFGSLHKLEVLVEKKFEKIKKAIFASGSPNYSIELAVKDFIKLEKVVLASFGVKKKIKKQKKLSSKKKIVAKKSISKKKPLKKIVKKKK